MVGAQGAWVIPLFTKKIQLQAVVQATAGAARDYSATADGKITVRKVGGNAPGMGQLAGQVQVVVQPFDGIGLQFFLATQGSITQVSKLTTLDGTPLMGGIQWAFDLP